MVAKLSGETQALKLGRYEVVRELGKGAMGIVYLARDPLIGRMVALKTVRVAESVDEDEVREFKQRFIREAQAAGILSHPSIVTVHDIGQDGDSALSFIAMEYVEGNNLKEALTSGEALEFSRIADIIAQVAEGLDYAHSKGIVHRDVKPANIILCGERAKITDFGIAKLASTLTNLTSTGQFLGTPNYMSPEQVKGGRVDGRSDLFSLGIVLYEALTRKKPFGGDSLTTISYKIVHEPFPSLREIDERIPEGFDRIIDRCLAKNPDQRYQRGHDLAVDLHRVVRGEAPILSGLSPDETLLGHAHPDDETVLGNSSLNTSQRGQAANTTQNRERTLTSRIKSSRAARTSIPGPLFFGILAALAVPLAAVIFSIWQGRVKVPAVDTKRAQLVASQIKMRDDAELLLRQGNTEGAHSKYRELLALAPNSQFVRQRFATLEAVQNQQLTDRQRKEQASAKFGEGRKLYEEKKFEESLVLFQEALLLNPELDEAMTYLRLSREFLTLRQLNEQPRVAAVLPTPQEARKVAPPVTAIAGTATAGTATLIVSFRTTVPSGFVLIKVNGVQKIYENLYTERSGIRRRKAAKPIQDRSITIPSGAVKIETTVVIPEYRINEQKEFPLVLNPGSMRRLTMSLDTKSRRVVYN